MDGEESMVPLTAQSMTEFHRKLTGQRATGTEL